MDCCRSKTWWPTWELFSCGLSMSFLFDPWCNISVTYIITLITVPQIRHGAEVKISTDEGSRPPQLKVWALGGGTWDMGTMDISTVCCRKVWMRNEKNGHIFHSKLVSVVRITSIFLTYYDSNNNNDKTWVQTRAWLALQPTWHYIKPTSNPFQSLFNLFRHPHFMLFTGRIQEPPRWRHMQWDPAVYGAVLVITWARLVTSDLLLELSPDFAIAISSLQALCTLQRFLHTLRCWFKVWVVTVVLGFSATGPAGYCGCIYGKASSRPHHVPQAVRYRHWTPVWEVRWQVCDLWFLCETQSVGQSLWWVQLWELPGQVCHLWRCWDFRCFLLQRVLPMREGSRWMSKDCESRHCSNWFVLREKEVWL